MCVPVSQECLDTRPKESKHACKFLGSLIRGSLVKAQASARLDVPTSSFFAVRTKAFNTCVQVFVYENAWICARPTTDRDLVSVIQDKKEEKKERKRERERK